MFGSNAKHKAQRDYEIYIANTIVDQIDSSATHDKLSDHFINPRVKAATPTAAGGIVCGLDNEHILTVTLDCTDLYRVRLYEGIALVQDDEGLFWDAMTDSVRRAIRTAEGDKS